MATKQKLELTWIGKGEPAQAGTTHFTGSPAEILSREALGDGWRHLRELTYFGDNPIYPPQRKPGEAMQGSLF